MKINRKHYKSLTSTQDLAKDLINLVKLNELTVITCESQTKNQTTEEKSGLSPQKMNIYATFNFCSVKPISKLITLSLFFSLIVARLLYKNGFAPTIKWPSDILLSKKKVGGILTDVVTDANMNYFNVGLGLNVNMNEKFLAAIKAPATSLMQISGKKWNREELLTQLLSEITKDLPLFLDKGFANFQKEYESLCETIDKTVIFEISGKSMQARHIHISKDGGLVLQNSNGQEFTYHTGSITSWE